MSRASRSASLFVAIALLLQACATQAGIRPFTTDGCSRFFDGTPAEPELWKHCCTEHDFHYWRGGTFGERREADRELQQCVEEIQDPVLARLMRGGVRVGGSPYWPTSYRWGYGWPYGRGYSPLSEEEQALADRLLDERAAQPDD